MIIVYCSLNSLNHLQLKEENEKISSTEQQTFCCINIPSPEMKCILLFFSPKDKNEATTIFIRDIVVKRTERLSYKLQFDTSVIVSMLPQ